MPYGLLLERLCWGHRGSGALSHPLSAGGIHTHPLRVADQESPTLCLFLICEMGSAVSLSPSFPNITLTERLLCVRLRSGPQRGATPLQLECGQPGVHGNMPGNMRNHLAGR